MHQPEDIKGMSSSDDEDLDTLRQLALDSMRAQVAPPPPPPSAPHLLPLQPSSPWRARRGFRRGRAGRPFYYSPPGRGRRGFHRGFRGVTMRPGVAQETINLSNLIPIIPTTPEQLSGDSAASDLSINSQEASKFDRYNDETSTSDSSTEGSAAPCSPPPPSVPLAEAAPSPEHPQDPGEEEEDLDILVVQEDSLLIEFGLDVEDESSAAKKSGTGVSQSVATEPSHGEVSSPVSAPRSLPQTPTGARIRDRSPLRRHGDLHTRVSPDSRPLHLSPSPPPRKLHPLPPPRWPASSHFPPVQAVPPLLKPPFSAEHWSSSHLVYGNSQYPPPPPIQNHPCLPFSPLRLSNPLQHSQPHHRTVLPLQKKLPPFSTSSIPPQNPKMVMNRNALAPQKNSKQPPPSPMPCQISVVTQSRPILVPQKRVPTSSTSLVPQSSRMTEKILVPQKKSPSPCLIASQASATHHRTVVVPQNKIPAPSTTISSQKNLMATHYKTNHVPQNKPPASEGLAPAAKRGRGEEKGPLMKKVKPGEARFQPVGNNETVQVTVLSSELGVRAVTAVTRENKAAQVGRSEGTVNSEKPPEPNSGSATNPTEPRSESKVTNEEVKPKSARQVTKPPQSESKVPLTGVERKKGTEKVRKTPGVKLERSKVKSKMGPAATKETAAAAAAASDTKTSRVKSGATVTTDDLRAQLRRRRESRTQHPGKKLRTHHIVSTRLVQSALAAALIPPASSQDRGSLRTDEGVKAESFTQTGLQQCTTQALEITGK